VNGEATARVGAGVVCVGECEEDGELVPGATAAAAASPVAVEFGSASPA
jgi:hypothetical protein